MSDNRRSSIRSIWGMTVLTAGLALASCAKGLAPEEAAAQVEELLRPYRSLLIQGLEASQRTMPMSEQLSVENLAVEGDEARLMLYVNRFGEVRWHEDADMIGKSFDEFTRKVAMPTDAIEQSYVARQTKVRRVPKEPFYRVSVPLLRKNEVAGVLLFSVPMDVTAARQSNS